jgi:hypothetical protein
LGTAATVVSGGKLAVVAVEFVAVENKQPRRLFVRVCFVGWMTEIMVLGANDSDDGTMDKIAINA